MLRDAQVIQKFSFIESLSLSSDGINRTEQIALDEISAEKIESCQQQAAPALLSKPDLTATLADETANEASAMVAAANIASTINTSWYESDSDSYSLNLEEINNYSASEQQKDDYAPKNRNYLGKILFALSCSYFLFVLWWLFGHQGETVLTRLTGGQQITLSKSDAQFIDYIERSLASIDRQVEENKENSGEDHEVVYVPVYTPTSATPTVPQVSQVSSNNLPLTSLPKSDTPTIPEPVAMTQPQPTSSAETLKIPAPPPPPTPNPLSSETSSQVLDKQVPDKIATATTKPAIKHTLIGILELGENKSAALIKAQGQTRRIWVGEEISNGGWLLESVANQTAKISYQGQVRSVAVGETF